MNSLDPRVNRLLKAGQPGPAMRLPSLDQFGTWEVFVQPRLGKPFQHEGIVHAPNSDLAFVLAKETFTRRFACTSLCVAETRHVFVSLLTEGDANAYDGIAESIGNGRSQESYEVFHLLRRGKQHVHAGTVLAADATHAMAQAKKEFVEKPVRNVWVLRTADIRFTTPEENDLWETLPDKKFREATAYRGGDKLKEFLARRQS